MTLDGAPLRRAAGLQPQQRWSVPADGALEVQPLEAPPEPPPRAPAAPAPAPGAPGRRSWSSGSADSALSSEPEAAGLRVVLLGAPGAGKSTLAGIFAGVDGADSDCEVLAEDTYERTLVVDGESTTIILLDMWENKGENEWLQDHCMQVGDAYLIVYSITDRASFEKASELRIQLRRARQTEDIPIILVGNKSDLVRCREVSTSGLLLPGRGSFASEDALGGHVCVRGASRAPCMYDQLRVTKAGPAPWCSTASSSRRRRPCSTTCRSCSRASCGRSASAGTARRRTSGGWPSRSGGRASPGRPGASGARSWPKTRAWPSSSSPSPATTSLCSRHPEPPRCPPRGHR
ncbi:GTP-binding protein GEM isoform X1 [Pipistrellus kuhlii]|uniref:GTP-binding protein GEM isoform X1 n=1 Tax=Pipistrellus kuhlii TaxID=59472 RepID=UPI001E2703DB|nr:GTP-binding protein GEM isoform X1 [Pipistrellus kuhlii]